MALKNPYEDEKDTAVIRVSPVVCWAGIALFLLVCVVPPLLRNVTTGGEAFTALFKKEKSTSLGEHLSQAEKTIEDAPFTIPIRTGLQKLATATLRQGNSKTVIGKDGWLFLRPGVESLTSTGPLQPSPLGPASDPTLKKMNGPAPAIKRFAADLKERGIRLLLVPVPIKPTIHPEKLSGSDAVAQHPDAKAFYADLEAFGIEILDLTGGLTTYSEKHELYLKQDTHWNPLGMLYAAEMIARRLKDLKGTLGFSVLEASRTHKGDLAEKLEIPFPEEEVTLEIVSGETRDRRSKIILLGDSFVNIFHDPTIGFGDGSGEPINAGLAEHLACFLKTPIDVIAKNGDASTGVRQEFGKRPDNQVRDKKVLVWVIAARDLFYTPKLAAENNVTWGDVVWNPESKPYDEEASEALVIEATLKRVATYADPSQVNYPSSTYETEWKTAKGETYRVKLWAFKESKIVPTGRLKIGNTYRLNLVPEESVPAAASAQSAGLDDLYFGDTYFSDLAE